MLRQCENSTFKTNGLLWFVRWTYWNTFFDGKNSATFWRGLVSYNERETVGTIRYDIQTPVEKILNSFDIQCVVDTSSFSFKITKWHWKGSKTLYQIPKQTKTVQNALDFMMEAIIHKPCNVYACASRTLKTPWWYFNLWITNTCTANCKSTFFAVL